MSKRLLLTCRMCLVTVLAAGSVTAASVESSHDPTADFSKFRTFEWAEGNPARSPELRDYLKARIAERLAKAGLKEVDSGADLRVGILVVAETGVTPRYKAELLWGVGVITAGVDEYEEGTLVVDLVDVASERRVWHGRAAARMTDASYYPKLKRKIDKVVRKMFRDFPPGS